METLLRYFFVVGLIIGVVLFIALLFSPGIVTDGIEIGGPQGEPVPESSGQSDNTVSSFEARGENTSDRGRDKNTNIDEYTVASEGNTNEGTFSNFTDPDRVWFDEVGEDIGLDNMDIREYIPENSTVSPPKEGEWSGIYVSDYNHDLRPDLLSVLNGTPVMYKNTDGGYTEADVLPEIDSHLTASHFFDYDNDGYDDLYLLSDEKSVFLENKGGEYERKKVGLELSYESVRGATTADYTGNGCLDLFVIQSQDWDENRPEGLRTTEVDISEDNGNPNRLFAGDCSTFEEKTDVAGVEGDAWSLATSFVDLTNDGYPDIHVANDFNNDVMYFNNGDGTFERHVLPEFTNRNGMSSEVADINDDGFLDIFVSNIHHRGEQATRGLYDGRAKGNNLLLNQGNGTFVDAAGDYDVQRGGFGWSTLIEDFNNNGNYDIYQSNSRVWSYRYPNFWKGTGDGLERLNSSEMGFITSEHLGAAAVDYDNDGTLDIATSGITQRAPFYSNIRDSGNWIAIILETEGNHTTLGSRVQVTTETKEMERVKASNSDYFSQGTRTIHFGLGNTTQIEELRVEWADGGTNVYEGVEANRYIRLTPSGVMEDDLPN